MTRSFRPLCLFLALTPLAVCAQGELEELVRNGSNETRINCVFLAEGYTTDQRGTFRTNALAIFNRVVGTAPFTDYAEYFNAFGIFVASDESGADHPTRSVLRNTYFNSTYDSYGIDRLITIPPNDRNSRYSDGRGRVDQLLATHVPEYDLVFLVVNDPEYGGSGGWPIVTSTHESSAEIGVHELGHSFAGLGDEYSSPYPGYPDIEEPNTTRETNRANLKWNDWVLPSTPLPTPTSFRDVIGLFEGAHYHETNWYRPKYDCYMRSLNVPFCEVCAEALVLSTYEILDSIGSFLPATNFVSLIGTQQVTLSVEVLAPETHALQVRWFVNETSVPGGTNLSLQIGVPSLRHGSNTVEVVVKDPTLRVRNDPLKHLEDSVAWTIVSDVPPRMTIESVGVRQVLSWPETATGYVLEHTPVLVPGITWFPVVTQIPSVVSNRWVLTNHLEGGSQFFRLRKP